jgi:hypothetical protein
LDCSAIRIRDERRRPKIAPTFGGLEGDAVVDRRVKRIHQVPLFFQMWWLGLVSVRRVARW